MRLKKVKNFPSRMIAEQAQDYLRLNGIEGIIQSPDVGIFGASGSTLPQGADLYVLECDYEPAYNLIFNTYNGI